MKVAWICHFSNREIQKELAIKENILEFSPWVTLLANLFEERKDIELHIISPHEYLTSNREFTIRGIHYHFFNAHIPFWGRHWPKFFRLDYLTNFSSNNKKITKIINRIKPDIIHLHGAENAYYSSSILQFIRTFPILVTVQGFISHYSGEKNFLIKRRIKIEQAILKEINHFGYRTESMGKDILKYNPYAKLHWHQYPIPKIQVRDIKKSHDLVFFGRITHSKGIEDLLKAVSKLRIEFPKLRLLIIGGCNNSYLNYLKDTSEKLGIKENITWAGFLPTQYDVHKLASSAKITVLPTHHDIISGTVIESMFLKIPVIANAVGSIPELNSDDEVIKTTEPKNITSLVFAIKDLLLNEKLRISLAEKAYQKATTIFDNRNIISDLLIAYSEVIQDYKKNSKLL